MTDLPNGARKAAQRRVFSMNAPSSTRFFTPHQATPLTPDTILCNGTFVIHDVLGSGGFGITYRALDVRQNREVALKELFISSCHRTQNRVDCQDNFRSVFQSAKVRFLEQARILSQLRHPNIVRVSHFFEENETAYLVMELLSGQTLLDIVQKRGASSESEALDFIGRIADATEAIHRLGLLHLDIKPENVIVTKENRVVLMDFDLVQKLHAGEELDTRPLDSPSHCGTPGYAPIEQYSMATRFSPATDIYALGATLHHLITGKAPLPALERAHNETLHFPDSLNENVRRAIEKSLQILVKNRPQNVRAFRDLLHPETVSVAASRSMANTSPSMLVSQNGALQNAGLLPGATAAPPYNVVPSAPITNAPSTVPAFNPQAVGSDRVWRVRVSISSTRNVVWPSSCPCCGVTLDDCNSDFWEGGRVAQRWRVPHCDHCVQHIDAVRTALFVGAWGMIGGLLIAALGLWMGSLILGPIGLIVHLWAMFYGLLKSVSADTMKHAGCIDKYAALRVREVMHNNVTFEFRRRDYAEAFRQLNGAAWG